jgi:hypothetical protein
MCIRDSKYAILHEHCEAVGRDYEEIERSTLQAVRLGGDDGPGRQTPGEIVDRFGDLADAGAQHVICSVRDVHDPATIALLATDVIPAVHALG